MLYQRRSTTFELMSLDETAGTSGAAGSTAGTSAGLILPAEEGAGRKHSSTRRLRTPRISTDSADNEAFEDGGERPRRKSRQSSTLIEIDDDGRRATRRHHRGSGGSRRRESKEPPDLLDTNLIVELASDLDAQPSPSMQMDTLHLPRQYASSRASCSSASGSSPSAASRRIDPTMTTTISEMIADDYVNDDDDSFAIFRDEFDADKQNRLRYNYVRRQRKRKSQKRNRPHEKAADRRGSTASDYAEENRLLPHNGNERSVEDDEEEEEEEDNSSYVGEELDELEQYEIGDRLGELLPVNYGRRSRREGVPSLARQAQLGSWDAVGDYSSLDMNEPTPLEFSSIDENPSKGSEDEESDEQSGIRKYAKLILPHVGLVVLTCVYTLVGASIFYSVENPNELATKRQQLNLIYAHQAEFVSALMRLAGSSNRTSTIVTDENWSELARAHMHVMSDQLFIAFDKYFLTANEVKRNTTKEIWTFSTALFFSVTVVTTIGYGNPVPVTQLGRLMCIGFSLFGIPLTLVTIADMGKFLSERLIWAYGKYLRLKHFLCGRIATLRHKGPQKQPVVARFKFKERPEHVCDDCQHRGLSQHMHVVEEQRIPALLVFGILVLYTALGGVFMSMLEPWNFFTSFYWSFITMTTVGFGDLMPRRDQYMYLILLYIILGLAITTMCIDLVGVQYIRKIHYFGRKIQDARSALAVVGGKVVLVSELYANLMQKRARNSVRDAFIIDNLYVSKHIIPYIPSDIRFIRYIDDHRHDRHRQTRQAGGHDSQPASSAVDYGLSSISSSTVSSLRDLSSCRFCHSRFSISNHK